MRTIKNIFLIAAFLTLIFTCSVSFADFKFAAIGDSRSDNEEGINVKILSKILEQIKSESPVFIIMTGDLITGSRRNDITIKRLNRWKDLTKKYGMRIYVVPGNHEIETDKSEGIMRTVFEMPKNGPKELEELAYCFNYKNCHFIGIDTAMYNNFHSLGKSQMDWLKHDLIKNSKKINFVFGHDPAYPVLNHKHDSLDKYPAERDTLWGLFRTYGVAIYFCGHEHLYNKSIKDGVYQIITGGSGANLSSEPDKGGFYHYVLVNVKDNGRLDINVKDIDGNVRDSFTIP